MRNENRTKEPNQLIHETFILAISILAILNILIIILVDDPDMDQVLVITNFVLSLILLVDFFYRFFTSEDKLGILRLSFRLVRFIGQHPDLLDASFSPPANNPRSTFHAANRYGRHNQRVPG